MQKASIIVKDLITDMRGSVQEGISFSLLPGEHLAILGAAGSGKTTFAKALAGKIHYKGTISVQYNGVPHTHIEYTEPRYSFKNLCGIESFYYQQRFNSFDSGDAPSILEELLKPTGDEETEKNTALIENTLDMMGIAHLKNAPLIQLSSGEHKRFQLAKALIKQPQLLILDTPYTGLDATAVKNLDHILTGMAAKGTQIILIPGTFPIPGFITDIIFLGKNKMLYRGTTDDFDREKFQSTGEEEKITYDRELMPADDTEAINGTVVEMKSVTLQYQDHLILKGLNWKIQSGEKWLIKGRNGAGKSSLISMITGDHPQAYSNEIYLFGKRRGSGESIWDIKKKTGYISPELHAYFDKSISCSQAIASGYYDTIGLFRKLSPEQHHKVFQWLDFLQLSHVSNQPLQAVSSSIQRMILLARALVKNPPLLLLDEPCQGLDEKQSAQFVSLIDSVCRHSAKTLIYVSHDETNIPSCIRKVLQLEKGVYKTYLLKETTLAVA